MPGPDLNRTPADVLKNGPLTGHLPDLLGPKELRDIRAYWTKLNGAPGAEWGNLEAIKGGHRVRHQYGTIYRDAAGKCHWVYGAIFTHYHALGEEQSWLGFPTSDEQPFPDGGRVTTFQHGAIYWWPDTGAIDLNDVIVEYRGVYCQKETTWDMGSNSDEPYVVLTSTDARGQVRSLQSRIYDDVDSGERRPDTMELYRGRPYGLRIGGALMEHDFSDPKPFRDALETATRAAAGALATASAAIPIVGPAVAVIAAPLLQWVAGPVAGAIADVMHFQDDHISDVNMVFTGKQMALNAKRVGATNFKGLTYQAITPPLTGDGAKYYVCFGFRAV